MRVSNLARMVFSQRQINMGTASEALHVAIDEFFAGMSTEQLGRLKVFELKWQECTENANMLPVIRIEFFAPQCEVSAV